VKLYSAENSFKHFEMFAEVFGAKRLYSKIRNSSYLAYNTQY